MRITGGRYKGRSLRCPKSGVRPVTAKMREAVFSILLSRLGSLEGLSFLDLFCGSGIMSLEAASRGVSYVEGVERDLRKRELLIENFSILQADQTGSRLCFQDVESYLRGCQNNPFDLLYIDPPFRRPDKQELLTALDDRFLHAESLVLLHHPVQEALPAVLKNGLVLLKKKQYGGSQLRIYRLGKSGM